MKIGIAGSGAMGTGIAQVAATAGHDVYLYDNNPQALQRADQKLQAILARLVEKGRITPVKSEEIIGRINYINRFHDFQGAQLVIEAIIEDLGIKQGLFEQIEALVGADCLLATNTSSLSVASIAAACKHPQRVLGLHFFNPAPLMALVEVIPAIQTHPDLLQRGYDLMHAWGKVPVIAKDTPGFIVNRLARPFYGEALRMYEEGIADCATIDWAMTELGGFRMGPFTLMDYIGHDVNYKVTETVFEAFYYDPRYRPSFTQKRLVEAGYLGRKKERGFYAYGEGATKPEPQRNTELGERLLQRILVMLINEAADALLLGVASKEDLDTAMTKGVNYPKGLLAWADELGIERIVTTLDALQEEYGEDRYRCSPQLRRMARKGETFY